MCKLTRLTYCDLCGMLFPPRRDSGDLCQRCATKAQDTPHPVRADGWRGEQIAEQASG